MFRSKFSLAGTVIFAFALFFGAINAQGQEYSLTIEDTPAVTAGLTTYRFYVDMNDATDRMSAVFGNDQYPLEFNAPEGAFNNAFNASWNASGINPAFLGAFPDLADDTYATVGLDGPASASGIAGAADPAVVEDAGQPITPFFLTDGATSLLSNTLTGASWYILNTASNGLPDGDMRVLIMQVTTSGALTGTMNAQVFPLGVGADQQLVSWDFDGAGTYGGGDVLGCTDPEACNYMAEAMADDGSCEYISCIVSGCTDSVACNYNPEATDDDGSCDFCSCQREATPYTLVVEGQPAVVAGMTTYRFYVTLPDAGDRISAIYGNNDAELSVNAPDGAYNSTFNASWNASGVNPAFLTAFPELASDTYATIGLEGPASASGIAGAADPSVVEDATQPITPFFLNDGATSLLSNTLTGASWYVLNTAANGAADANGRALIMQVTTAGNISGQINYQVFPLGIGENQVILSIAFDGTGTFGGDDTSTACGCTDASASNYDENADYDDGSCEYVVEGCTDSMACNYDADATDDDGSCEYTSCVVVEGCTDSTACNYDANATDDDGSCEYTSCVVVEGCTDNTACNYDADATDDDGSCVFPEPLYDCDNNCINDEDADGVCDELEVPGCQDSEACNFDATATDDDGSCEYTSCVDIEGCTDDLACNYNPEANVEDGSCDFCSCQRDATPYTLVVEGEPAVVAGLTTYKFYVTLPNAGDRMSAVFGNNEATLSLDAPDGVYNSTLNASWNASGINPAFLGAFPELVSDTYATIGLTGPASSSGIAGAADPSVVEDAAQPITPFFLDDGATSMLSNSLTGASWYVLNTAANGEADSNGRSLIMQVTTAGDISGQINYQVFPLGVGEDQVILSIAFDGEGTFGGGDSAISCGCTNPEAGNYDPSATYDDGSCELDVPGCSDAFACNYNPGATDDDGSCVFCDCGAAGVPAYTLTVESTDAVQEGLTVYRFFMDMVNATDKLSAMYGDADANMSIQAPAGIYNSEFNLSWNASGISSAFLDLYPELADDSYATIGLDGPASQAAAGSVDPDLAELSDAPSTVAAFFTTGGLALDISTSVGAVWYVAGPATNANAGDAGRVLAMQVTTSGPLYGTVNAQIFPEGDGDNEVKLSWTFAGEGVFDADGYGNACGCTDADAGNYDPSAEYDDGTCVFGIPGCTDSEACNYDETATIDDDSCVFAATGYDCEGECLNDDDGDGVCNEFEIDGCTNPAATNYDENATEDDGSCEVLGCTYIDATNYNDSATDDDGSCEFNLSSDSCPGDLDGSGLVQLNDLLDLLLYYGNECED